MTPAFDHCASTLRLRNRDRYLAMLLAPESKRACLAGLYALDCELAAVGERITEPLAGEIRLQWWRDTIAGLYKGESGGHPVIELLGAAIEAGKLPRQAFEGLIDARIFDLYDDPMPDMGKLEAYLGATHGAMVQMSCLILGEGRQTGSGEAAGHAAMAEGLASILCGLASDTARGRCYLPAERMAAHGVKLTEMQAGKEPPGLRALLGELSESARRHLDRLRAALGGLEPVLLPAFAPCGAVLPRLKAVAKNSDPLHKVSTISPLKHHWAVRRAGRVGL